MATLNPNLIAELLAPPKAGEPATDRIEEEVLRSLEIRELAVDGDVAELQRRCRAELSPEAYDLASAWVFAAESETSDYYSRAKAVTVAKVARHFPGFEMAIRAVYDHLEAHEDHTGHDTSRDWAPCCSPPACCAWPAVDDECDPPA
jgi:hypothetical protein